MKTLAIWTGAVVAISLAVVAAEACTPCYVCSPVFLMPLNPGPSLCNTCGFYYRLPDGRLQGPNYVLRPSFPPVAGFSNVEIGQSIYALALKKSGILEQQAKDKYHQQQPQSHGGYGLQAPQQQQQQQGQGQQQEQPKGLGIGNRGGNIDYSEPYKFNGPDPLPGGFKFSSSEYRPVSYQSPYPAAIPNAYPSGFRQVAAQQMVPGHAPQGYYYHQSGYAPQAYSMPYPTYNPGYNAPPQAYQLPPMTFPQGGYAMPPTYMPTMSYAPPYTNTPSPSFAPPYTSLPTPAYAPAAVPAPGYTMANINTPNPSYNPALINTPNLPMPTFVPPACPPCGPMFSSHGYVRSPRDFFMWGENQLEQKARDRRPSQVP